MDEQNIQAQQVQNKNMKPCPSCGNMISKKAKACPACGAKIKKPVYKRAWFIVLMVIIAISVIAAVAGSGMMTRQAIRRVQTITQAKAAHLLNRKHQHTSPVQLFLFLMLR